MELAIYEQINTGELKVIFSSMENLSFKSEEDIHFFIMNNNSYGIKTFNHQQSKVYLIFNTNEFYQDVIDKLNERVHEIKNLLTIVVSSSLFMMRIVNKGKILEKIDFVKKSLNDIDLSIQNIIINLNGIGNVLNESEKQYKIKVSNYLNIFESEVFSQCDQFGIKLNFMNSLTEKEKSKFIQTKKIQLNQISLNLVKNAIFAINNSTRKGNKELIVGVEVIDSFFKISIQDSGDGIKDSLRDKIFEKGFTTKGEEGSGLGLALSQKVLKESGGDLELDESFLEGARFIISLPFA